LMNYHSTSASRVRNEQTVQLSLPSKPNLSALTSIYVLPAHIATNELHEIEHQLVSLGAPLTYDIREACLVLGKVTKPRRARFELQARKLCFKDVDTVNLRRTRVHIHQGQSQAKDKPPPTKRRKFEEFDAQSTDDDSTNSAYLGPSTGSSTPAEGNDAGAEPMSQLSISQASTSQTSDPSPYSAALPVSLKKEKPANLIMVIDLAWLKDSARLGKPQDLQKYLVHAVEILPDVMQSSAAEASTREASGMTTSRRMDGSPCVSPEEPRGIVERAKAEAELKAKSQAYYSRTAKRDRVSDAAKRDFTDRTFTSAASRKSSSQRPHLLHESTSDYEEYASADLPPMPDWVREKKIYACQRVTPLSSQNDAFIAQLKQIKTARLLTNDEVGVRAYSTSIASLAAYPYAIRSTAEVLALPGCDRKIARLFHEWQTSSDHCIQAAKDVEKDPILKVLRLFYDIWGVGATTAREFYYDKKWQDLDDVVEYGWGSLSRLQQIGVKYYDEFLLKIPRSEVEAIAGIVEQHACKVIDKRIVCVIVGGYRRGKAESGDVDLILSHPEQIATAGLVEKVVDSLEQEGWITHTLTMNLTNTKRGQETLPYISNTKGAGFDTLDKALVVWQDQAFPGKGSVDADGKKAKNPNPHRRVDIIIAPWRTIGCAVAGWTSGTTFQRDLRRYAKRVKGWKFDSSGIRERGTGKWIDVERWTDPKTRCTNWKDAEKRVFDSLGLEFFEPWERCTG
ncbi:MAG: hypothetical protein Q9174_001080, partial [Haloplaca sp. 1 TL-2023]